MGGDFSISPVDEDNTDLAQCHFACTVTVAHAELQIKAIAIEIRRYHLQNHGLAMKPFGLVLGLDSLCPHLHHPRMRLKQSQ